MVHGERSERSAFLERQVQFQLGQLRQATPSFSAAFADECAARGSICALYNTFTSELNYSFKWKGPIDDKRLRIDRFLKDIIRFDPRFSIFCDLQDAVWRDASCIPAIQYTRCAWARNAVLWPLAGYHEIGSANYVGAPRRDKIPLKDKIPKVFWRGMLSGHSTVGGKLRNILFVARDFLGGKLREEEFLEHLNTLPRFKLVSRYFEHSSYDIGFVIPPEHTFLLKIPAISQFVKPRTEREEQFKYRYLLALSGNDAATSFPWQAESNSVVLREVYHWQLFFDCHFSPWLHYIPIAENFEHLTERLSWCEQHLQTCERVSANAQEVCRYLADPELADAALAGVVAELNVRYGAASSSAASLSERLQALRQAVRFHPERLRLLSQAALDSHPRWADAVFERYSFRWPLATWARYHQDRALKAAAGGNSAQLGTFAANLLKTAGAMDPATRRRERLEDLLLTVISPLLKIGATALAEETARLAFATNPERTNCCTAYLDVLCQLERADEALELIDYISLAKPDQLAMAAGSVSGPEKERILGRLFALHRLAPAERERLLSKSVPGPWLANVLGPVVT